MKHVVTAFPQKDRQLLPQMDHIRLRIFRIIRVSLLGVGVVDQDLRTVRILFDGKIGGQKCFCLHQITARRRGRMDIIEFFHQIVVIIQFF